LPIASVIAGLVIAGLYDQYFSSKVHLPLLFISVVALFVRSRWPFIISISLVFFLWGNLALKPLLCPDFQSNHIKQYTSDSPLSLEGVVYSRPEVTEKGCRLYLKIDRLYVAGRTEMLTGRMVLYTADGKAVCRTGDRVRFMSRVMVPRRHGLPGEFDYQRFLAFRGIYVTGFVTGADDIVIIREGVAFRWQRFIDLLAQEMGDFIGRAVPGEEGGVLRALLLGERGYIPKELEDAYANSGVNHILSISGFHVGIISIFIFQLLFAMGRFSSFMALHCNLRRTILVVTLPVMVFYLFLTGTAPATVRSVVMIAAFIMALLLERESDPIDSLILSALLILGVTPEALFDISFQLSFLALWGILVLTPIFLAPFKQRSHHWWYFILPLLFASLSAILVTFLPVVYYFGRGSVAGLVSNLVVVPLMGYGSVIVGFTSLPLIYLFPPGAEIMLKSAAFLVKLSDIAIIYLAKVPSIHLISPDRFDLLLLYLVMVVLSFIEAKNNRLICSTILVLMFIGNAAFHDDPDKGKLRFNFLSVGQGEATLVLFPDGRNMLIDGGGATHDNGPEVGRRLLGPALLKMGVNDIDYMVLTHSHPDHMQGLLYVASNFRVGEFWESGISAGSSDYWELHSILEGKGVPILRKNGNSLPVRIGDIKIEFLSPSPVMIQSAIEGGQDINNTSLVMRIVADQFAVLFAGDIGLETEKALLHSPELLRCSVLKVAHHGSRFATSERFLEATQPKVALISAGFKNNFHLPSPVTLSKLDKRGIDICRTDLDGTVSISYDSRSKLYSIFKNSPDGRHFN
jgi:competence protein ComEC